MSLNDRDALAQLHAAIDPADENGLIGRFYTRWFSFDVSPRDLFPPDMAAQRAAFAQALKWVYGELVAQRAEEPVAFLAQLGRDHRKYGVVPEHYETLGRRCTRPCETSWPRRGPTPSTRPPSSR